MEQTPLRAPVFNLVNGSFVDGPGIRTTIFLKGCLLRCKWCCNPEGQSFQPEMRFLAAHCRSGCSDCVSACPEGAIRCETGTLKIDRAKCIGCGRCETACFEDALRLFGKWYTPEDLMGRIRREKPYLTSSGGGVTIGGGEATCWSAFCRELIRLCHAEGIHTAIDSCGYPCTEEALAALYAADLVLFDLKGIDSARHHENTGAGNEEILRTFEHLRTTNKPVIVRAPLVPGYNDSPEELAALGRLLRESPNVERVDLMPYHEYGVSKYEEIGLAYPLAGKVEPYSQDQVRQLLEFFRTYHPNVQIGG